MAKSLFISALIAAAITLSSAAGTRAKQAIEEKLPFHPLYMHSNVGWHVTLQLFIPVKEILVEKREGGGFRSTGFLQSVDPETRLPQPNPTFHLDKVAPLRIRLVTHEGEILGPYPVEFDPLAELQKEGKRRLEMASNSWLAFKTMIFSKKPHHLVYFTHLISQRCAINEVRYSFESEELDRRFELPPCDLNDPSSIPSDFDIYMKVERPYEWTSIQLVYADGTESEVVHYTW